MYRYEYHWADGTTVKKPLKCSAPKYIDYLMTWVQEQLDDETIFPSKIGECFMCGPIAEIPLIMTDHLKFLTHNSVVACFGIPNCCNYYPCTCMSMCWLYWAMIT